MGLRFWLLDFGSKRTGAASTIWALQWFKASKLMTALNMERTHKNYATESMFCDEIRTQQFVREWGFFSRGTWYGSSSVKPSLALYQQYDCCTAVDTWSKLQNKSSANIQGYYYSPTLSNNCIQQTKTLDRWQKLWFRASPVVLSMWPCKIFLTFKFSNLLFSNPSHKTKTGTAIDGRLLVATHLDQSNYLANQ
jgi:hypothetical protein